MSAPRIRIDLEKIRHNTRTLVERLAKRGIDVTGVTKATVGSARAGAAMLSAGATGLGDSRIENIEAMRRLGMTCPMTLLRSPMLSQARRIVESANTSLNTELEVIDTLSHHASQSERVHAVVLMVELGDLREGLMPGDLSHAVREALRLPYITLRGIGTNLACHGGVVPDAEKMSELSKLADSIESEFGVHLDVVSGGNSANLDWALGTHDTGRVNNLRLGESLLLGREPLHRHRIDGLHTDAVTLIAEVIESKVKPRRPWGNTAQSAFGDQPAIAPAGFTVRTILALGHQDTDPSGLEPPEGFAVLGASSDHLILNSRPPCLPVGSEVCLGVNYSALLRAMTSASVAKSFD